MRITRNEDKYMMTHYDRYCRPHTFKSRLRWVGHVIRMDDENTCFTVLMVNYLGICRSVGKEKLTLSNKRLPL